MNSNTFILKKNIDWSFLVDGFTIPLEFIPILYSQIGTEIRVGESRKIQILIDGQLFDATLKNLNFSRSKYYTHKDILQIRYSKNSPIAKRFQSIFVNSYNYFIEERLKRINSHKQIKLPEGRKEYIALFATSIPDVFALDYYVDSDYTTMKDEILGMNEIDFELQVFEPLFDYNTGYTVFKRLQKVRKLDYSIADSLKQLYKNRCQITGETIGEAYGNPVIEAHHIQYFTESFNNDTSNIIIINPNFHRIIHKNKPDFDRENLCFIFPNGYKERVKLDLHLQLSERNRSVIGVL